MYSANVYDEIINYRLNISLNITVDEINFEITFVKLIRETSISHKQIELKWHEIYRKYMKNIYLHKLVVYK